MNVADRAPGAVIGALVGDALGLGLHWYSDLTELRKDWITGYTNPKPGRYHSGMKAGPVIANRSHSGHLAAVGHCRGKYQEADFTDRLDRELAAASGRNSNARPRGGTPINPFGKRIGPESSKSLAGAELEDMPIPPKRPSEPWLWPRVMCSILGKLRRRSLAIAWRHRPMSRLPR
jgi:hypothetical protein